jgi:hypothetical protein
MRRRVSGDIMFSLRNSVKRVSACRSSHRPPPIIIWAAVILSKAPRGGGWAEAREGGVNKLPRYLEINTTPLPLPPPKGERHQLKGLANI